MIGSINDLEVLIIRIQTILSEVDLDPITIPFDLALDIQRTLHERKEIIEAQLAAISMTSCITAEDSSSKNYLEKIWREAKVKKARKAVDLYARSLCNFETLLKTPREILDIPQDQLKQIYTTLKFWFIICREFKIFSRSDNNY